MCSTPKLQPGWERLPDSELDDLVQSLEARTFDLRDLEEDTEESIERVEAELARLRDVLDCVRREITVTDRQFERTAAEQAARGLSDPGYPPADTPSLQDRGIVLGSYAS